MQAQDYWNQVGSKKEFEDPLYLERLSNYLTLDAKILEYGCGYGRLLQILKSNGYSNLFKTMNNNPARTFHCIAQKIIHEKNLQ